MSRYRRILGLIALALAVATPARAESVRIDGYIAAASGSPQPARTLYRLSGSSVNEVVGYVAPIPVGSDERAFTLTPGSAGVDLVDLDAWFYTDIAGLGEPCARSAQATVGGGEKGTVCAGAAWVVVVLLHGADTDFTLTLL